MPELAKEIAEATAFVLLVGKTVSVPGRSRNITRHSIAREGAGLPRQLMLLDGQPAPGLPFLRQLHWIVTADPASEQSLAQLLDAAAGAGSRRRSSGGTLPPYRGLAAMTEADSDFFFGRERRDRRSHQDARRDPDQLPVLLGNSGVGKSSLAQAGVLAALKRQAWPEGASAAERWPQPSATAAAGAFSRSSPGTEPIKALVEPFLETWQFDATDPNGCSSRAAGSSCCSRARPRCATCSTRPSGATHELNQPKPLAFFLYVDQGEELYVRAEERQRRRFSEILRRARRPAPARTDEHARRLPRRAANRRAARSRCTARSTCRRCAKPSCAKS